MKTTVNIYLRKKTKDKHSIENLFDPLVHEFIKSQDLLINKIELPHSNKGILNKLKNIKFAWQQKADVHHISGDIHYISYFFPPQKTIITVHDLNYTNLSHPIKNFLFKIFWIYLPFLLAKKIIAISEVTKKQISAYYSGFESKTIVIPNFVREEFLLSKPTLSNRKMNVVLHIGTKKNKNLEGLILALKDSPFLLIIIGKLTHPQKQLLLENKISYHENTHLSLEKMIDVYLTSSMLHFCSLTEGFGLPILEAQSTGLPVITSNIAPMSTVAGSGAILVDPYKTDEIRQAILEIHNNSALRESLVHAGYNNVKKYTLDTVAESYLEIYRTLSP